MKKSFGSLIKRLLLGIWILTLSLSPGNLPTSPARAMAETDGSVIAYVAPVNGREDQIHLIDPDGQNDQMVWTTGDMGVETGLRFVSNLAWKPDGTELGFNSSHQAACSQLESDIYSIRADGSHLRRIPYKPYCGEETDLPTGTVVVTFVNYSGYSSPFVLYLEGAPAPQSYPLANNSSVTVTFQNVVDYGDKKQWGVAVMGMYRFLDINGAADVIPGQTVEVTVVMGYGYTNWTHHDLTWSHDGTQTAFVFGKDTNPYGLAADDRTVAAFGSHLLQSNSDTFSLPMNMKYLSYGPTASLSNKLLYAGYNPFVGDGGDHIYLATVGEMEPGEIVLNSTDLDGFSFKGLDWLPDGSGFVFSMEEEFTHKANLYRYSFATGQSTRLSDYPYGTWTREVSVSPDGTRIVYELQTEGDNWYDNPPMDLYIMNADGTGEKRLLVADARSPEWGIPQLIQDNPVPGLTSLNPSSADAGGAGFTLTASGSSFVNSSVVRWNGEDLATTYVNATTLTAQVPAGKIAAAGTASVTIFNPAPGGGASGPKTFTINSPGPTNPIPELTSLDPSVVSVGGASFTLTVSGSQFVNASIVRWDTVDLPTTYVNATTLTAQVTAAQIASTGPVSINVFNPAPGGGEGNALTLSIVNPVPVLLGLNPSSATAGGAGFSLTINGRSFTSESVVQWNGTDLETTYTSPTILVAEVTAAQIATAGTASVTVYNPAPGGGESGAKTFTINNSPIYNPVPVLNSLTPSSAIAGATGFNLTISGSGFTSGSVVRWNGEALTTTFVNATTLTAQVPAGKIASAGTASITVFNPAPGGGTSNTAAFSIGNPPAPTTRLYLPLLMKP